MMSYLNPHINPAPLLAEAEVTVQTVALVVDTLQPTASQSKGTPQQLHTRVIRTPNNLECEQVRLSQLARGDISC